MFISNEEPQKQIYINKSLSPFSFSLVLKKNLFFKSVSYLVLESVFSSLTKLEKVLSCAEEVALHFGSTAIIIKMAIFKKVYYVV